jgi:hypothetical protein
VVTGVAAIAAALSFVPDTVPAAPPPVRLEGPVVDTEPTRNELVVVPFPSVEFGEPGTEVTSTTVPLDVAPADEESVDVVASPDEVLPDPVDSPDPVPDDSAGSPDTSADSADSITSADSPDDD